MAERNCSSQDCEAHAYVISLVERLEGVTKNLMEGQADIKENIIRLTENLLETQRLNLRFDKMCIELKEKDDKQDAKIEQNSAFVNKAVGVIGAISLIAAMGSMFVAVLNYFFK